VSTSAPEKPAAAAAETKPSGAAPSPSTRSGDGEGKPQTTSPTPPTPDPVAKAPAQGGNPAAAAPVKNATGKDPVAETGATPSQGGPKVEEKSPAATRVPDNAAISATPPDGTANAPEEAEILPPEHGEESLRGKIVLLLRALGRPRHESSGSALVRREAGPLISTSSPPALPPPRCPDFLRRHALFLGAVLLPTLIAALYFGFVASDVYVSESRFVVRTPNKQTSGGLSGILQGAGFSGIGRAPEDVHTVGQYVLSRDALNLLDDRLDLRTSWGSPQADLLRRFDPFGWDGSREALFEYYPRRVSVVVDPGSGITTLTVSVFTPEQAATINEVLLGEAESLVNLLNNRARNDLIRFAENEVKAAEDKAKNAARAVSNYRNTEAVVDPEKQTELHFTHISRLQEELMRTESQLTQLRVFAPDSPHPPALELRAQTLQSEITKEMEKITGGENSLASKAAEYERLALEREFADKQLAGALASLELARNEAQRQQLYLETIAKPSRPDGPLYPRRLRGVLTTFVLGLVAWGILSMLLAGVREHQY